jgi:hypothetical protein
VSKTTKVKLRFGGGGAKAGDVVELDPAAAAALVANGNAVPVKDEPKSEPVKDEKPSKG